MPGRGRPPPGRLPGMSEVAEAAAGHHERADGAGYPNGRPGDAGPAAGPAGGGGRRVRGDVRPAAVPPGPRPAGGPDGRPAARRPRAARPVRGREAAGPGPVPGRDGGRTGRRLDGRRARPARPAERPCTRPPGRWSPLLADRDGPAAGDPAVLRPGRARGPRWSGHWTPSNGSNAWDGVIRNGSDGRIPGPYHWPRAGGSPGTRTTTARGPATWPASATRGRA